MKVNIEGFTWYYMLQQGGGEKWLFCPKGYSIGDYIPKKESLGLIERAHGGEWLCYVATKIIGSYRYIGFEPNKHHAKARVIHGIIEEVRPPLVLACEPVKPAGSAGATVQNFSQGEYEQSAGRIQGRVQGDSKQKRHKKD